MTMARYWHDLVDRRDLTVILFIIVIPGVLWSTTSELIQLWSFTGFQHGYLVPIVSGYLLWQMGPKLAAVNVAGSAVGCMAFLFVLAVWIIAGFTYVQVVEQMALIALIACAVWAALGWNLLKQIFFPIGFLIFAIPFGFDLIPILMDLSAGAATTALKAFGMPVYRDGFIIHLAKGSFEVAEACSGFKFVFSGTAFSVLLAYVSIRNQFSRVLFVLASGLFFVFLNWVRIVIVIVMINWSDMQMFLGNDHLFVGWLLFAAMIGVQTYVASQITRAEENKS